MEEARQLAEVNIEVSRKLNVSYQLDVANELIEAREAADWVEWQLEQTRK